MLNSWIPFPCYASWSEILLNHISSLIFFPYSLFSPFACGPFHPFIHVVSLVRRHCFFSSNRNLSWWILFRSCPRGLCSTCSCSIHPCCWCCTYCILHANSMVNMDCILLKKWTLENGLKSITCAISCWHWRRKRKYPSRAIVLRQIWVLYHLGILNSETLSLATLCVLCIEWVKIVVHPRWSCCPRGGIIRRELLTPINTVIVL